MPNLETFLCFASTLVFIYFSGALLIAKRLEKNYPALWGRIGRPSLLNWGIANSSRLGHAVFFGSSLGGLNDRTLSALVCFERVIGGMILAVLGVWLTLYHGGHL